MSNVELYLPDRIIVGDGLTVMENKAIAVSRDGLIEAIDAPDSLIKNYPEAVICSMPGTTLLPGLIDMHVHIGYWWGRHDEALYNQYLIACQAQYEVSHAFNVGVTTLRDVSSAKGLMNSIKQAVKAGFFHAPRLVTCGQAICMTGGHAYQLQGGISEIDSPWDIRKAIRERLRDGADWIKLMASHRTDMPEFTLEELEAAVDEAHRLGKKICVHAGTQPAIQMCIDTGFDTIEHGTFMTPAQAKKMVEQDQTWVPTIVAYGYIADEIEQMRQKNKMELQDISLNDDLSFYAKAIHAYRENFKSCMDAGVRIAAGTDMVMENAPLFPVVKELEYMIAYGMDNLHAIQAATENAAYALGFAGKIGQIKNGLQADFIMVRGNPLEDISHLSQILKTVFNGKCVYSQNNEDANQ